MTPAAPADAPHSASAAWLRVLHALILREIRCRFAGDRLGYLWAYLLPLAWTVTLMVFFDLVGRRPALDAAPALFVATGILPYYLFRQTVSGMAAMLSRHRLLTGFAQVRATDILLAGAVLELVNGQVVAVLTFAVIDLFFAPLRLQVPHQVMTGLLLASLLGACTGWATTVLGELSVTARRVIPVLLRPLFWISGVFFLAADLPPQLREALWYNPLLHAAELTRAGAFTGYPSGFFDPRPALVLCIAACTFAILLQAAARRTKTGMELA